MQEAILISQSWTVLEFSCFCLNYQEELVEILFQKKKKVCRKYYFLI